jgi:rhodanese-related sulfurtransferase
MLKTVRIKLKHTLRAYRYGLFNARKIFRFMKKEGNKNRTEMIPISEVPVITVNEAEKMMKSGDFIILDVRAKGDYENVHIWDSVHIEFTKVLDNLELIPSDKDIGVICYGGGASEYITQKLLENGYPSVMNIKGGIIRWALDIDDSLLEYL